MVPAGTGIEILQPKIYHNGNSFLDEITEKSMKIFANKVLIEISTKPIVHQVVKELQPALNILKQL